MILLAFLVKRWTTPQSPQPTTWKNWKSNNISAKISILLTWEWVNEEFIVVRRIDVHEVEDVLRRFLDSLNCVDELNQRSAPDEHIHTIVGIQFAVLVQLAWRSMEPTDQQNQRLRGVFCLLQPNKELCIISGDLNHNVVANTLSFPYRLR